MIWDKIRHEIVLVVASLLLLPIYAAPNKTTQHNPLTHKYKDAPLSEVFADITKKCDYELVYDPADIDLDKRITMHFKDASAKSVLKKVLDKDLEYKVKKGKIYINRKPAPPIEYRVTATEPTSVTEDSVQVITVYTDTLYSIACRTITVEHKTAKKKTVPTRKGHYIQSTLGLGYSSLGYTLRDAEQTQIGSNKGDFGGNIRIQYAYFFNENWGIVAGLGFSGYGSFGVLNQTQVYPNQITSNGDPYTHLATAHDYKEHQVLHTFDIPVGAQYQYALPNKMHLYAGLGLQLGIPVYNRYQVQSATLEQSGYFPQWGLTIRGADMEDHDFYTEKIENSSLNPFATKKITIGVTADVGVMIPVTEQIDVMVGAYATVNCNNLKDGESFHYDWRNYTKDPDHHAGGMVQSSYVQAVRPYQVGVRVGVSWHAKPVTKTIDATYERIQTCDTTRTLIARNDTILKPIQPPAQEIQRLMRKSVIWFDVNSIEPKLHPADILDRIADVLIQNPEQKIIVSGHASIEGNAHRNRTLSEERARVIADILIAKGVRADQLIVEAHSSDIQYQTEDGSAHSISLDRRTEIIPVE